MKQIRLRELGETLVQYTGIDWVSKMSQGVSAD